MTRLVMQGCNRHALAASSGLPPSLITKVTAGNYKELWLSTAEKLAKGLALPMSLLLDDEPLMSAWLSRVEEHDRQQLALAPAAPPVKPAAPAPRRRRAGVAQKAELPYFQPINTVTTKISQRNLRRGRTNEGM